MNENKPWIGVDLDGTLAHYEGWKGPDDIGEPIQPMLRRVRQWIAEGIIVKIFTARASIPEQCLPIRLWLCRVGLGELEITNVKDFGMVELWDDRAVQVVSNTGIPLQEKGPHQMHWQRRALKAEAALRDIRKEEA